MPSEKPHNKVILVLGSPGAGKTTLIEGIKSSGAHKLNIINIGTLMLEESEASGISRDKLRYLTTAKIRSLREKAFKRIGKMSGTIVVDTHATVEKGNKFIFGLPINNLPDMGNIAGIIYVDATPGELMRRRSSDTMRKRENDDIEVLNLQREINLAVLTMYGTTYDIPVYILHNKEGELNKAMSDFGRFVEDIISNYSD